VPHRPRDHYEIRLPEIQYDTREKVVRFHEALLERLRTPAWRARRGMVSVPPGAGFSFGRVFSILEGPHPATAFSTKPSFSLPIRSTSA